MAGNGGCFPKPTKPQRCENTYLEPLAEPTAVSYVKKENFYESLDFTLSNGHENRSSSPISLQSDVATEIRRLKIICLVLFVLGIIVTVAFSVLISLLVSKLEDKEIRIAQLEAYRNTDHAALLKLEATRKVDPAAAVKNESCSTCNRMQQDYQSSLKELNKTLQDSQAKIEQLQAAVQDMQNKSMTQRALLNNSIQDGQDLIITLQTSVDEQETKLKEIETHLIEGPSLKCEDKTTQWNEDGAGSAWFLDRHAVFCDQGELLSSFRLRRNHFNRIRYIYTCCTL